MNKSTDRITVFDRKWNWRLALLAAVAIPIICLAACGSSSGSGDDDDTVTIGAFVWTQGGFKTFGDQALAGVKLAVNEVNKDGGVDGGKKVKLNVYEEGLEAEATTKSIRRAKSDGVAGIIGFADATAGTVAASVSQDLDLPIVVGGSGTGEFVRGNKRQDLVHVQTYPEAIYPEVVKWAQGQGVRKIVQVAYDSAYSRVSEKTYRRALEGTGIDFPETIYVPYGQTDISQAIAKAAAEHPDLLVFDIWGGATVGALKRLKELGYDGPIVQAQVSMVNEDAEAAGDAACNFMDTEQFLVDPDNSASADFVKRLTADQPGAVLGGQTENFYEGTKILLAGIDKGGTSNPEDIGKAMRAADIPSPRGGKIEILPNGQVYVPHWYLVKWNCEAGKREILTRLEMPKANFADDQIIVEN